jgi:hypothetical protein
MRRTKTLTLKTDDGDLEVVVYEVRPLDFLEVHKEIQAKALPVGEYERLLPLCINIPKERFTKLYPGEIEEIIDAFKEVNSAFLAPWPTIKTVIEKVGLGQWLADLLKESKIMDHLRTALSLDLQRASASLPREDIEAPNSTDGGSSGLH